MINEMIDLEFFNEDEEQVIFEDAVVRVVKHIEASLPSTYLNLVHVKRRRKPKTFVNRSFNSFLAFFGNGQMIEQQNHHPNNVRGIDEELAETMVKRLLPSALKAVELPHLGNNR